MRAWATVPELSGIDEELWRVLCDEQLILETHPHDDDAFDELFACGGHGWYEAAIYHESTRDFPFVHMDEPEGSEYDEQLMSQFAEEEPPPPVALHLDGDVRISLQKLRVDESADSMIESFAEQDRRGRAGLSLLLDICSGERERRRLGPLGDTLYKAVPSGGARHPTEAFLALFDGAPEAPGLYHYDVIRHELVMVRGGNERREWDAATLGLLDSLAPTQAFAVVVLATMWERAMWRYRDARSWRAPVMDIGHVVGAYRTVLTRLGLSHASARAFDNPTVSGLLELDWLQLTPMSVIAFG